MAQHSIFVPKLFVYLGIWDPLSLPPQVELPTSSRSFCFAGADFGLTLGFDFENDLINTKDLWEISFKTLFNHLKSFVFLEVLS